MVRPHLSAGSWSHPLPILTHPLDHTPQLSAGFFLTTPPQLLHTSSWPHPFSCLQVPSWPHPLSYMQASSWPHPLSYLQASSWPHLLRYCRLLLAIPPQLSESFFLAQPLSYLYPHDHAPSDICTLSFGHTPSTVCRLPLGYTSATIAGSLLATPPQLSAGFFLVPPP